MSYLILPETNLDPSRVFDKGCYDSRLKEKTAHIVAMLVDADVKKWAKECRLSGEVVTPYPLSQDEILQKFEPQAILEAKRILEEEKRLCVEARANYIRDTLNLVIRKLRLLVFTPSGKGTTYVEKKFVPDRDGFGVEEHEIAYFESFDGGVEIQRQIDLARGQIGQFNEYAPYMSADLLKLYQEAYDLGNIPKVWLSKNDPKLQTQTETPKAQAQGE